MQDAGRTYLVCTPEPGSWSALRAYSNPPEYTYYTHKLLERRVADEIALGVLSSFVEEVDTLNKPDRSQKSGPILGVGQAVGAEDRGKDEGGGEHGAAHVVHHIRRKRRRPALHAAAAGPAL